VRLALQTDFALRTLIYLAGRPGRAQVRQVAEFYRISAHHVAKAVNQLARLGFVRSIRGVGGGLELGRNAADIRLGEVVQAMEGNLHLLDCVGTDGICVIQPNCKLRRVLAQAEKLQIDYLNSVRLIDVVRPAGGLGEFRLLELSPSSAPGMAHGKKRGA
jgi:Rrf2 family transcriptional regulator, nitric oxide-sensitive transcriptional repressor